MSSSTSASSIRLAAALLVFGLGGCVDRVIEADVGALGTRDDTTSSSSSASDGGEPGGESSSDTGGPECVVPQDCPENATCFEGVCVGTGELRISLSWAFVSDLDLHVETPTGAHISFENPTAGGGLLDVDDCIGGECLDNDGTHVENIYFPRQPPLGTYKVWVYNFDGRDGGPLEIEVSGQASATFSCTVPASPVESQVFKFEL